MFISKSQHANDVCDTASTLCSDRQCPPQKGVFCQYEALHVTLFCGLLHKSRLFGQGWQKQQASSSASSCWAMCSHISCQFVRYTEVHTIIWVLKNNILPFNVIQDIYDDFSCASWKYICRTNNIHQKLAVLHGLIGDATGSQKIPETSNIVPISPSHHSFVTPNQL